MVNTQVLVGSAKGLVVFNLSNSNLLPEAVHFKGFSVTMIFVDPKNGDWWIGLSHRHWGQKLHRSPDQGKTWSEVPVPSFGDETLSNNKKAVLRQIWTIERSGDTLWMGTDPGGLFKSEDNGKTFELVRGLWDHPSRKDQNQWFGAGSDYPFIHSIVPDPKDSNRLLVGVSCAGVFETKDHGLTWEPKNTGLKATYLPNENADVGHDPHWMIMCSSDTHVIWQQNHCGVYLSKNGGDSWENVSGRDGLPNYGFALAIDHKDPAKAWVIPAESDDQRNAPDLNLRVFRTNDFGKHWKPEESGLPSELAFDIVLRQAFHKSEELMVFGTNSGNLYQSHNEGKDWILSSSNLSKVNTVLIVHPLNNLRQL